MIYRLYKPGLPLSQFIDFFFYYEGLHAEHCMEKLLPDGSIDLLIDLTETPKKLFLQVIWITLKPKAVWLHLKQGTSFLVRCAHISTKSRLPHSLALHEPHVL